MIAAEVPGRQYSAVMAMGEGVENGGGEKEEKKKKRKNAKIKLSLKLPHRDP